VVDLGPARIGTTPLTVLAIDLGKEADIGCEWIPRIGSCANIRTPPATSWTATTPTTVRP
jgi:hypothetical protein